MVNKIVHTYKFNTQLSNIETYKDECKIWLVTILEKYNVDKGSKAFSYFSVVTKHWFLYAIKKEAKKNKNEIGYEDILQFEHDETLASYNTYIEDRSIQEFWIYLWEEIYEWEKENLKPNEKKVLEAVIELLKKKDSLELLSKKAIYLYLRELTGLNTKQVVSNLNKFRAKYTEFKAMWDNE